MPKVLDWLMMNSRIIKKDIEGRGKMTLIWLLYDYVFKEKGKLNNSDKQSTTTARKTFLDPVSYQTFLSHGYI